jgi:chemotaxis protein CheC
MNQGFSSDEQRLAELRELFSSATHDASAAMCRWTNGLITVALDDVREIAMEEISNELEIGDDLLTMVVLTLEGELGGTLILVFDEVNGRQLVASLLGQPAQTDEEWSELEQSALTETGNILGCAYVNALTRLLGQNLVPSPPYFLQDFGGSVLEQAVMAQAMTSDKVLLCNIGFHRQDKELDWQFVFVPTLQMQQAMEHSLHAMS